MPEVLDEGPELPTLPKPKRRRPPRPPTGLQAVVVIHGMGEQRPMDTLRSFVRTLWEQDPNVHAPADPTVGLPAAEIWSKPDTRTGSLELRRITTRKSKAGGAYPNGVRTDF